MNRGISITEYNMSVIVTSLLPSITDVLNKKVEDVLHNFHNVLHKNAIRWQPADYKSKQLN